jgi:hypothetical protein
MDEAIQEALLLTREQELNNYSEHSYERIERDRDYEQMQHEWMGR